MPKVAAIIPSRWGSTRFPGKPLHLLAGKPLVQHVWERVSRAKRVDEVVVATDDMRIAEAAFAFGAEVAVTSPDHRSGTDRIAEVARRMRGVTHIFNIQGDEPLIEPSLIDRLVKTLVEEGGDMITAATPFLENEVVSNPNAVKVVTDRDGNALYFSRSVLPFARSSYAKPYLRHLGLYGYSRKFLLQFVKWHPSPLENAEQLEQLRALENGARIRVITTRTAGLGVDTPEDAMAVEARLASGKK
jgi:3-deoxy-manno-octulosonate cytidylyltransferase (CMP-KDO synthetase)